MPSPSGRVWAHEPQRRGRLQPCHQFPADRRLGGVPGRHRQEGVDQAVQGPDLDRPYRRRARAERWYWAWAVAWPGPRWLNEPTAVYSPSHASGGRSRGGLGAGAASRTASGAAGCAARAISGLRAADTLIPRGPARKPRSWAVGPRPCENGGPPETSERAMAWHRDKNSPADRQHPDRQCLCCVVVARRAAGALCSARAAHARSTWLVHP